MIIHLHKTSSGNKNQCARDAILIGSAMAPNITQFISDVLHYLAMGCRRWKKNYAISVLSMCRFSTCDFVSMFIMLN